MRIGIILLVGLACPALALGNGRTDSEMKLDDWIRQNVHRSEKVLCERDVSGDYFFVSRLRDKLKFGSRLDLSAYNPPAMVVRWTFRNERGEPLSTSARPVTVKQDLSERGTSVFAENIHYRELQLLGATSITVNVSIKKCSGFSCNRDGSNHAEYAVTVCTIPAGP